MKNAIRGALIRGGTSKGLFLRGEELAQVVATSSSSKDALIARLLGSPDPSGLQLNGVGGGISSTSKVAIITRSSRPGYDVDYLFGQVSMKSGAIDWSGSCGNLAAGVGIFAKSENLLQTSNSTICRVWQANLNHGMKIHLDGGSCKDPVVSIAGVPGEMPPIYVEFLEPSYPGMSSILPTGEPLQLLSLSGLKGKKIGVSLVVCANPTVFVSAVDICEEKPLFGWKYEDFQVLLSELVKAGAQAMGIEASQAVRVAFLSHPTSFTTTSGTAVHGGEVDILSRITTEGRFHHAHTSTGAINLAVAGRIPGTIPWKLLHSKHNAPSKSSNSNSNSNSASNSNSNSNSPIRIGHPGGTLSVDAAVKQTQDGKWKAQGAGMLRTARCLVAGNFFLS